MPQFKLIQTGQDHALLWLSRLSKPSHEPSWGMGTPSLRTFMGSQHGGGMAPGGDK